MIVSVMYMHISCVDLCVHVFMMFMMHLCVCVGGGGDAFVLFSAIEHV